MAELKTVSLCQVDINNRYDHSIYFASRSKQSAYFQKKVHLLSNSYTQIRREYDLQVSFPYEQVRDCNYLYFAQDGKTWYYFIVDIAYKNEGSTILKLELDVIQTYMFDWVLPACFIERQHTETDNMYEHTVDEGLECGELINKGEKTIAELMDLCCLVFSTIDLESTTETQTTFVMRHDMNGVFSGVGVYAVDVPSFSAFGAKLEQLSAWGKIDGILSMHMYPKALVKLAIGETWESSNVCKPVLTCVPLDSEIDLSDNWDGDNTDDGERYAPMNNKLYCYPYNMLCVSNNNGGIAVYKYERMKDPSKLGFRVMGALTMDSGCKFAPLSYNTTMSHYNDEEGLTLTGFPSCAWQSDTYKVWLAQNQNQHALITYDATVKKTMGLVGAVSGMVGSAVTGNALGVVGSVTGGAMSVYSSAMQIKSLVAQQNDMSITPPQARGNMSPTLNVANSLQNFSFIKKGVTPENARIIDDFLNMYGYKLNRVQQPNIHTRQYYTHIKTVGCVVNGNFNNNDKMKIANIFDKGITFWVNGDAIGHYNRSNTCLS